MDTFTIHHGEVKGIIGGPFAAHVVKDDGQARYVVSSCTGIRTMQECDDHARFFAHSFNAKIVTPFLFTEEVTA